MNARKPAAKKVAATQPAYPKLVLAIYDDGDDLRWFRVGISNDEAIVILTAALYDFLDQAAA